MRRTRLISGQHTAVASGKAGLWMRSVQFRQAGAHGLPLKPLNPPLLNIPHMLKLVYSLPSSFRDGCPREHAICAICISPFKPAILQQKYSLAF